MIKVRIQIGDGDIKDTLEYGLIFMESDKRMESPIKKRDTTSYAEEAGEHTDPRTVQDAFDYKVKFVVEAPNKNLQNANAVIAKFNKVLYEVVGPNNAAYAQGLRHIRHYKTVTFYDDYKRVKIVGLPEPIAEVEKLYRRQSGEQMDCAVVELTIHVSDPTKCDFNMSV